MILPPGAPSGLTVHANFNIQTNNFLLGARQRKAAAPQESKAECTEGPPVQCSESRQPEEPLESSCHAKREGARPSPWKAAADGAMVFSMYGVISF